uniref:Alpha/beta hydrolase n=1 Tax=Haemonchus placei TaxID=6290 RepID=A0A0N4VX38_HAEPC
LVAKCAPQSEFLPLMIHGRPRGGFVPLPTRNETYAQQTLGIIVADWFVNRVNHFSDYPDVYNQRYWYYDQWYRTGGPAFLMLGGEGAQDPSWLQQEDLEWIQLAKQHGAMLFLLEHRYYGQSRPTPDMSTVNLWTLSSAQAIEDTAAFIIGMKAKFPQLANVPWVTFGGSYA